MVIRELEVKYKNKNKKEQKYISACKKCMNKKQMFSTFKLLTFFRNFVFFA